MIDVLSPAAAGVLFDDSAESVAEPEFTLWYRPSHGRAGWEPVATHPTEYACVAAIGTGGRHAGKWCVLPAGQEP